MGHPAVSLGLGWFVVSLLPVLHLVPLWADLADRFAFVPSVGLALVAAGAMVPQGMRVPPGSLVAGVPARVKRELTDEERAHIKLNAEWYVALSAQHRAAFEG